MKQIELSSTGKNRGKFFAKVDDEDFEWLMQWAWQASKWKNAVYATRCQWHGNPKKVRMHRAIMERHGLLDKSKIPDHRDRDGLNNQKSNLRMGTFSQNCANRGARGVSKYLGVSLMRGGHWKAQISLNSKTNYLGIYKMEVDAAMAYNKAATIHRGEFANLNTIPSQPNH